MYPKEYIYMIYKGFQKMSKLFLLAENVVQ
jgi:hypothetical protein